MFGLGTSPDLVVAPDLILDLEDTLPDLVVAPDLILDLEA